MNLEANAQISKSKGYTNNSKKRPSQRTREITLVSVSLLLISHVALSFLLGLHFRVVMQDGNEVRAAIELREVRDAEISIIRPWSP